MMKKVLGHIGAGCALLSLFGLAGCDVKSSFERLGRSVSGSMGSAPMVFIVEPGTVLNVDGLNAFVFGKDDCDEHKKGDQVATERLRRGCLLIKDGTKAVDVYYVPMPKPRLGRPEPIAETWMVERLGDKVTLRSASGNLIAPAQSFEPEGQFKEKEGS